MKTTMIAAALALAAAAPARADETESPVSQILLPLPSVLKTAPAPQDDGGRVDLSRGLDLYRVGNPWSGHSAFLLGVKRMSDKDWKPVEQQFEMAWLNDFLLPQWPFSLAFDVRFSLGVDTQEAAGVSLDTTGTSLEMNFGVRKVMEQGRFRPFIGAGLSLNRSSGKVEIGSLSASDAGVGLGGWADAGFYYTMSKGFVLGFEVAYSTASVRFDTDSVDGGGLHVGFSIGGQF